MIKYLITSVGGSSKVLLDKTFTNGDGFTNNTNGVFTSEGLRITGVAGNDNRIESNDLTLLEELTITTTFKIHDVNSKFTFCRVPPFYGTQYTVDLANSLLIIRNSWQPIATIPGNWQTVPINFTVNLDDEVEIRVVKNKTFYVCEFRRGSDVVSITRENKNTYAANRASDHGVAGVIVEGGDVTLKTMKIEHNYNNPELLIYGDSIVEGNEQIQYSETYEKRWAWQVSENSSLRTAISSRGGAFASTVENLTEFELNILKPTYCIVFIGVNNGVFSTFQTDYDAAIANIVAKGITPIVCTIPPVAFNTAVPQINAYVKSLAYDLINMAEALTVNGDEVTLDLTKFVPDEVHPNDLGYDAMYAQALNDVPYLF